MHPASNMYEVDEQSGGFRTWCGVISFVIFLVGAVLLAAGIPLFFIGVPTPLLVTGWFALFVSPIGLLLGLVGITRPTTMSIVGCLGNLLAIAPVLFAIVVARHF